MDVWERIKQRLATQLSIQSYRNWLEKTTLERAAGEVLYVSVPDAASREWIEQEYGARILSVIRTLGLPYEAVVYQVHSNGDVPSAGLARDAGEGSGPLGAPRLNPRFTFSNFVVGPCNQFAHAAARAVAETPARSYNPLFIYGGTGMGKTHLMHAIGHSLVETGKRMRVVYTTGERFMNELIRCIRTDQMGLFHRHYRQADVLLVDDIHVLGNKERTQEEFFHTFNELYDRQKQIVLSSDSPPSDVPGLVERLRSRFEWGLLVDVQPPDLETKMAILDRKAEMEGVELPEDVRIFIATKAKSNVRELEGALIKLIAYSSVTGEKVTLTMARQVLKHFEAGQRHRITIDSIIREVAQRFNLQPSQIKQRTNARKIAYPRQIAMYLAKELTAASLPEIGRAFGGKHHTTVLHSVQKIDRLRQKDPDLNRVLNNLIDSLS